jgi:FkbM family methyltransferase
MDRLQRKFETIKRWLMSVRGPTDWPAALLLAVFRTRTPNGNGLLAQCIRVIIPRIYFRPKKLRGYQIGINPADLGNLVIYEEVFIEQVYDLSKLRFRPETIIDCGAYEGYFTLLAKTSFSESKLLCFEPHPTNFAALLQNLSLNNLLVDVRREAVSVMDGKMPFSGAGCGGHLCANIDDVETARVKVSNLREIIENLKPMRLLLKLDIEGEEAKILPSVLSILPVDCAIFFEWHHEEFGFHQIEKSLRSAGFEVTKCRHRTLSAGTHLIDAFAQRYHH